MRTSYTAVIERNVIIKGDFSTEPYECGWASEAVIFVRSLNGSLAGAEGRVQISPDGMNWCDEGTRLPLPGRNELTFCRVAGFGNWLRIVGDTGDKSGGVIVTMHIKE